MNKCNGYVIEKLTSSNVGDVGTATKDGKRYCIKVVKSVRLPDEDQVRSGHCTQRTYNKMKAEFEQLINRRNRVYNSLKAVKRDKTDCDIIVPIETFVHDGYFTEITEYVGKQIKSSEIIKLEAKKNVLQSVAAGLALIHKANVVHGDLEPQNIVLTEARTNDGVIKEAKAAIINFDSSYMLDEMPQKEPIGDKAYASPELASCWGSTDPNMLRMLGKKSDIFSLGLIFHYYLFNELPKQSGKMTVRVQNDCTLYPWQWLQNGGSLVVMNNLGNVELNNLIQSMLNLNPNDRPSAEEVCIALMNKNDVFINESHFDEPWPEHKVSINVEAMKCDGYTSCIQYSAEGSRKYFLVKNDGTKSLWSHSDLVSHGYATTTACVEKTRVDEEITKDDEITRVDEEETRVDNDFCDVLFDSHRKLYRFNIVAMNKAGFVSVKRHPKLEKYQFVKRNTATALYTLEEALSTGLIISK